jgi:putative flippase GtrA
VQRVNRFLEAQYIRFVLVGLLNTGFSFGVYALLVSAGLHFSVANLCAFLLGVLFSFRTQGALVFGNRDWRLIGRFFGVWVLIFLVNTGLIALFVRAGLSAYLAGAVALLPVTVLSYLAQRFLVFSPGKASASGVPATRL